MLSGETAGGDHPLAAVTIMSQTCVEAEGAQNTNMLYQAVRNSSLAQYKTLSTSESIASSAVKTTIDCGAKAIVVCSESGTTATQVAKFRPGRKFCCRVCVGSDGFGQSLTHTRLFFLPQALLSF